MEPQHITRRLRVNDDLAVTKNALAGYILKCERLLAENNAMKETLRAIQKALDNCN